MRRFVKNVIRFCRDCLEALRDDDEEPSISDGAPTPA